MVDHDAARAGIERVRIVCHNPLGELLLIKWRDPVDGRLFLEPPGGGIEEGEGPREAAERELFEETGFRTTLAEHFVTVARDYRFAGRHHRHLEAFYLAEVDGAPSAGAFTEEELTTFVEWRYVRPDDLSSLEVALEPPDLLEIVCALRAP